MAKKKKEDLEQLHLAREQQIEDIRRAQAIELAREEQEFHQVNQHQHRPDIYTQNSIVGIESQSVTLKVFNFLNKIYRIYKYKI